MKIDASNTQACMEKVCNKSLKGDEFNSDMCTVSNGVFKSFFHIFVIVLLVECETSGQLRLTERHC